LGAVSPDPQFWAGKRVFITGHTGFKGGWLTLWLHKLGATLAGYALAPDTSPNFFTACDIAALCHHQTADIRDRAALTSAVNNFAPDILFHLAAQPLVRAGYGTPVETYATNIMGTAHVLDAIAQTKTIRAGLIITSDKVYAESHSPHDESARLGGADPYSASKAAAELITAAFPMPAHAGIATLRSGNVIGGGDWAAERLVPDFFRAMAAGTPWTLRNPAAIRPWQHVLDPLHGYLRAAEHMFSRPGTRQSWNFGPDPASEVSVETLAQKLCALWGPCAAYETAENPDAPHESAILRLNAAQAMRDLHWRPVWNLDTSLAAAAAWYRAFTTGTPMPDFTRQQIDAFTAKAARA